MHVCGGRRGWQFGASLGRVTDATLSYLNIIQVDDYQSAGQVLTSPRGWGNCSHSLGLEALRTHLRNVLFTGETLENTGSTL